MALSCRMTSATENFIFEVVLHIVYVVGATWGICSAYRACGALTKLVDFSTRATANVVHLDYFTMTSFSSNSAVLVTSSTA